MSVAAKTARYPAASMPSSAPTPSLPTQIVNLDFAASPNRYRSLEKTRKAKPKTVRVYAMAKRLSLDLSLQCETRDLTDSDYE
jgi:hypothetical protein